MCGIIGYIGERDAVPSILEGLGRLEYRGYDSAGIAVCRDGALDMVKRKGRIADLERELASHPLSGNVGIGHTRWATHGEPSHVNSHPHAGSRQRIAIVHNGIIENYAALRETLQAKGVAFASQTDSEVIAQLAEYYYRGDLMEAVVRVVNALEGSFALAILCADMPDALIAVKKDNPLVVGVAEDGHYIASDVPALLSHTRDVYFLEDREIAVLTRHSVRFCTLNGERIEKRVETVPWDLQAAEKGGYEHFMFKEIMEQPRVLRDTIASTLRGANADVLARVSVRDYDRIVIVACGSAYNAGMVGRIAFERLCRVPVEVDLASEFRYRDPIVDANTLVLLVSQSGETADTIAALREAKRRGAHTLSIVNVVGSTIAKESDDTLYTLAGPEIAVATTKAFSAQLAVLYALAVHFARELGAIDDARAGELRAAIEALPEQARAVMASIDDVRRYASTCFSCKSIFFIGRGIDYAIALEGSLKLKEISYIHSEAYAGGELKHGTISLIEENTLVVALSCCEALRGKIRSNVEQVISRGAKVLMVTDDEADAGDARLTEMRVPHTIDLFSPSLSVILLQLLSYYVAANKGLDIDKPRNLAKSVTVE